MTEGSRRAAAIQQGMEYDVEVYRTGGEFMALVPDVEGAVGWGATEDEAVRDVQAALVNALRSESPEPEPVATHKVRV